MTTINPQQPLVTLINVFTVEPENQERLVAQLMHVEDRPADRPSLA
jgi:hypothetical protein